ncbi:MAG: sodium:solute symporter family protein [Lunatimonas sp.]|uniref:sodium:solute symporter family protein n=1 Tax=Lunatimonas sp. TaxID=2060141 RepID=UPI00263B63C6|nr:sodium:solute symporter family protein [Lunatimonas sp.]MCC5936487.1 sodium:solute symporter family protein [Lunatimonas sp.]
MLAVAIVLYLLSTVAIGAWASKRVKNAKDFMLAGQQLPLFLSTSALFATWFGSETIFGASSEYLEHGLLGVIEDPFGGALCLILFGMFYVKPIYRMRVSTLGDVYVRLFGKKVGYISSLCMVPAFFGYTAAQLVALSLILGAVTGASLIQGILIAVIIVVVYTFLGGMWAISITDFIQTLVIVVGLIWVTVIILRDAGGASAILADAPPGSFQFFPPPELSAWGNYFGAWAILGLGSIPSQDIYQRVMASKSERVAQRSLYLAAACYLTFGLLPLFIALGAKTLYPDLYLENPQMLLPQMVLQHAGLGVQILFFGALLSAIMSTTSSSLLAPSAILSENILRPYLTQYSDRKMLWLLRINVVAVALVSVFMATWKANIYELVADASILLLVSLFVPLTAGLYWKKASKFGALLSIFFGMSSYFVLDQFTFAIPSFLLATACSALGMVLGTLIKPKNPRCNPIIRSST